MKPTAPAVTASRLALALGLTVGWGACAHAAGFYLQEQSVKGIGRAFSGEAADTGPESLWWNPASIAGATQASVYLGASGILPGGDVNDTGTLIVRPGQAPAPVGGNPSAHGPIKDGLLPSGGVAIPVSDKIDLGLAISSPFSFTTKYPADSWVRYTALTTQLRTVDVQPSIALAATPWLRLGLALNAEYSKATLSNALPNLLAVLPDGEQSLTGDGWNFGWSAGAQVHNDAVTVGLSYKSAIRHDLSGAVQTTGLLGPLAAENGTLAADAKFNTPWQVILGARYKATGRLTLNAEVVRLGWGQFKSIELGAPINAAIPENYQDTWSVAVGADYALCPKLTVRGGIQYDQTPTRDGQRDARVPDGDRTNFALGATYQATKNLAVDVGASYILIASAPVDRLTAAFAGTAAQTPILVSGETSGADAVVLAIGAQYGF